jgi:crotonobetaine/carnitine-CoA ligase
VAVPSPWGEDDVKVVVVPAQGIALDLAELHEFLQDSLPAFMVPRYIQVESALPRTATNKVRKALLRSNDHSGSIIDFDRARAREGST